MTRRDVIPALVGLLIAPRLALAQAEELHDRARNVACQRTTVSGATRISDCFQPDQNRRATTQNSFSGAASVGLGCRAFNTASCCRKARFSSSRSRREDSKRETDPSNSQSQAIMERVVAENRVLPLCSNLLFRKQIRVYGEGQL